MSICLSLFHLFLPLSSLSTFVFVCSCFVLHWVKEREMRHVCNWRTKYFSWGALMRISLCVITDVTLEKQVVKEWKEYECVHEYATHSVSGLCRWGWTKRGNAHNHQWNVENKRRKNRTFVFLFFKEKSHKTIFHYENGEKDGGCKEKTEGLSKKTSDRKKEENVP